MTIHRRDMLVGAAALPMAGGLAGCERPTDLAWLDATATADLIRKKEVTAAEVAEAAIARAKATDPTLHFLVVDDYARAATRTGSGPFAGVPTLIKDLDDLAGLPTRSGTRATAGAPAATVTGPVPQALLAAGFNPIGKSATPEFGFLPTTEPLAFTATANPWNTAHSSGGSSGGSAAAVAAGVVPVGHSTDGGGSIRIPASCCGLFGLKPSRGRMVAASVDPNEISVENAVTRSVRDAAGVFAALEKQGADATFPPVGMVTGPSTQRLRIGWAVADFDGRKPTPDVIKATEAAAKLAEGLGHKVEPITWSPDTAGFTDGFLHFWAAGANEAEMDIGKLLGRQPDATVLEPFSLGLAALFRALPPGGFEAKVATIGKAVAAYLALFGTYDVILTPVLGSAPPRLGHLRGDVAFDTLVERLFAYVGYTPIVNSAGNTAMSVPLGWSTDNLPIGAHFAAAPGKEGVLLALAYELEKAQPWAGKRPPVKA